MTPSDLISDCPMPAGHEYEARLMLRLSLRHFADHVHELTLPNGLPVRDPSDLKEFLDGCVTTLAPPKFVARTHVCPDCDHEHEGKTECKKYLGEGRFCPCESKVPA